MSCHDYGRLNRYICKMRMITQHGNWLIKFLLIAVVMSTLMSMKKACKLFDTTPLSNVVMWHVVSC